MVNRALVAAAGVNALIVLLFPGLLVLVFESVRSVYPEILHGGGAVRARPTSPTIQAVTACVVAGLVTVPLATLVAWRTSVHAARWQRRDRTWRGVAEAGAAGALSVFVMLGPPVIAAAVFKGAMEGFVAIVLYAAIFGVVGLVVGLLFQLTAIAVLKMASPDLKF